MAKKKRPATNKANKSQQDPVQRLLPDRRAMEGVMRQFVAGLGEGRSKQTPLIGAGGDVPGL